MANVDNKRGFIPVRHYSGGEVRHNVYSIASGLAANIGYGDPVKSTGTTKRITVAAAGDTVVGVFQGCYYIAADGTPTFSKNWATGTTTRGSVEAVAFVCDDPNTIFEIQASAGLAVTDVGALADFVIAAPDANGISATQLDSTTIAGTASTSLKIVELVDRVNNAYGTNAKVHVLINEHELQNNTRVGV